MASASFGPLVDPDVRLSTVIEQHDSLTILKGRTDQDVWNYINLSDDELTAINELRLLVRSTGCRSQDSTRTSLQSSARSSNVSSLSATSQGSASSNAVAGSSITSTESIPPNCQLLGETTLSRPLGQQAPFFELVPDEDGIHPNAKSQHSYWCTVCEPARHFETLRGWIKHENESHEKRVYVCMPDGPTANTGQGLICVLCGARSPDARHLEEHNIAPCLRRETTARTYTRFYQLEKHLLEAHKAPKGSILPRRWRRDYNKQAWACGLCVAYFAKANERYNHIAKQHYERGEDRSQWDPSKVILGLLQQPPLHKAWTERLKLEFPAGELDLRWDRTPTRTSLISMLELGVRGTEDGADLAAAAFIQSDYYQSRFNIRYNTITPIECTEHENESSQRKMQDSYRLNHDSHNCEQDMSSNWVNPIMDDAGWPHPSGHHLPQTNDVCPGQHREVLTAISTLDPSQIIRSSWPAEFDTFDSSSYKIQSTSHPEQSTLANPASFEADYASQCEFKDTGSSLFHGAAPISGEGKDEGMRNMWIMNDD